MDSRLQSSLQSLLHTSGLAGQPPFVPLTVIYLDRAGDAVAILTHALIALTHDIHHVVPLPFQHGPHGIETIVHTALVDDIQGA